MRYDKLGNAILHRLRKDASFAEVYLTAVELGFSIRSTCTGNVVLEQITGEDRYGFPITETRWKKPEEVVDYLNGQMEERGVIWPLEPEP